VLRSAVGCWAVVLVVSLAMGIDPRGSLLGTYQYRQGFLTQVAFLVLFLGALMLGRRGAGVRLLHVCGLTALGGVTLYAGIQIAGLDPLSWWVDTSERAISTIGNANELAGFAVLALAFAGAFAGQRPRAQISGIAAVAAAVVFVVLAAGSRSGLLALIVAGLAFPVASWVADTAAPACSVSPER